MKSLPLAIAAVALYALHQDVWFWRTARPLVFGFMPIGLFYHAAFCVAVALYIWTLTALAWPSHLEENLATRPRDLEGPDDEDQRSPGGRPPSVKDPR